LIYRGELQVLLPLKRKYYGQYLLLCLLKLMVMLLGLNALALLAAALFPWPLLFRIALNLAAAAVAVVCFWFNRPDELQFACWLDDRLGSKERLQTLFELEHKDRPPASRRRRVTAAVISGKKKKRPVRAGNYRAQTSPELRAALYAEISRYLAAHPPAIKLERRMFRRWLPALLLALILCLGSWYVAPILSQNVARGQELNVAQQEAAALLTELEEKLSEEQLLEELLAELALVQEQLTESRSVAEVEVALQEARELLAEYAEALAEAEHAYEGMENLLAANSAAEVVSALEEDPRFSQQLQDSLQGLQDSLFALNAAGALQLREGLSLMEGAQTGSDKITATEIEDLRAQMAGVNPASARQAVQRGLKQIASSPAGSGRGSLQAGAGSDSAGSGASGNPQSSGPGQGQGSPGETAAGTDPAGQEGAGVAPGGGNSGWQGSGAGGNSGGGSGAGGGGQGSGAGTGSGQLKSEHFSFIPGEKQVELDGTGEEGFYTWTELLNSNPQLVTEDCARYYDSYYRQGISSLNRGEVPPPLENYLRAYFQAIAPPSS
jgi:hypothetical protein